MTFETFKELRYTALSTSSAITSDVLKPFCNNVKRILDLGCGTGENLLELSKTLPHAELIGIDLSPININRARLANAQQKKRQIKYSCVDYLYYQTNSFDIIYADSVLHLIDAPDEKLFNKLSNDLNPYGILIVTMPYDCLYNRILIGLRRLLCCLRSHFLDALILKIAKRIYPSINTETLKDRIPYMYIVPFRLYSASLRKTLSQKYHLALIDAKVCERISFAKPKHQLIIFQKKNEGGSLAIHTKHPDDIKSHFFIKNLVKYIKDIILLRLC